MNAADLAYVCQLVYEQSAIVLDASKRYLVEGRLTPIARASGHRSLEQLIEELRSAPFGPLHELVVDALATHETSFFRDERVFNVIRSRALPELFTKRKKVVIWSAACSTGQEPYSLAMTLLEQHPGVDRNTVTIYATDLSERVLDHARAGIYSRLELNRGLTPELRDRYFEPAGEHFRVKSLVRELICFQRMNLASQWPFMPLADLVFLRNVLIYFDQTTRAHILERMRRNMHNGGYLVLGTSETTVDGQLFERLLLDGTVMYRSVRNATTLPGLPTPSR